jgi:hypothetical protein
LRTSARIYNGRKYVRARFEKTMDMDAFWLRSPGTVTELTRMFREEVALGRVYDFQMFPKPMGPFPPDYDGGMRAAIGLLHRSKRPEKHEDKLKFSSARKTRSVHSNMSMASALGGATAQSVRSDKGHQALTTAPTDAEWFGRFMTGLRARVGERRRQDAAISIALMIELQYRLEVRWLEVNEENDCQEKRKAAENGVFFVWTDCSSLRGF